jgi:hypothetical protein
MAKDFIIDLEDRPGSAAATAEALGKAGVNITGFCALAFGGKGFTHILVEDATATRRAIEQSGFKLIDERDVVLAEIPDRPGELGKLLRRIAEAGVNLNTAYLAPDGRVVLVGNNVDKLAEAVGARRQRA